MVRRQSFAHQMHAQRGGPTLRSVSERMELAKEVNSETDEVTAPFQSKIAATDMRQLALVAHNHMKPAMKKFIETYSEILKKFRITGTQTTMKMCKSMWGEDDTSVHYGLTCTSGPLGGDAQIAALMCMEDLGGIIFFVDPLSAHPHQPDIDSLLRLANCGNIIVCSNPSSASSMMHTLRCALLKGQKARGMIPSFFETLESPAVEEYRHHQAIALANVLRSKSLSVPTPQAVEPPNPKEEKKEIDAVDKRVSFGEDDLLEVGCDRPARTLSDSAIDRALLGNSLISGTLLETLNLLDSDEEENSELDKEVEDDDVDVPVVPHTLFGIKTNTATTS